MEKTEYFRIINRTESYDEIKRLIKLWASNPDVPGDVIDYAARHAFSIKHKPINRWVGD